MKEISIQEAADEFLVYLKAIRGFSDHTIIAYGEDLKLFMSFFTPHKIVSEISLNDLNQYVAHLTLSNHKSSSINRNLSCIRTLFAYCKKNDYIQINHATEIKNLKVSQKLPRYMTEQEVFDLCKCPEEKDLLWACRDEAIFEMFYSSGCRVSELCGLKFEDFSPDYSSAIVLGKGNKQRRVFFEKDARNAFVKYLKERKERFPQAEKNGSHYVSNIFLNQKGGALSVKGLWFIVRKYSGIEGVDRVISPHAFRHTFATQMLNGGADVRTVQYMLGHVSISTTQRYMHVSKQHLREVYDQAFPHSGYED